MIFQTKYMALLRLARGEQWRDGAAWEMLSVHTGCTWEQSSKQSSCVPTWGQQRSGEQSPSLLSNSTGLCRIALTAPWEKPVPAPGVPQCPPARNKVRGCSPLPAGSPPAGEHHPRYLIWPSVPEQAVPLPLSQEGLSPRSLTKWGRDLVVCFGSQRKAAGRKEGGEKAPGELRAPARCGMAPSAETRGASAVPCPPGPTAPARPALHLGLSPHREISKK